MKDRSLARYDLPRSFLLLACRSDFGEGPQPKRKDELGGNSKVSTDEMLLAVDMQTPERDLESQETVL
jgi:hypothetical protein